MRAAVVVDADFLIAVTDAADAHYDSARAHFRRWRDDGTHRLISAVNVTEAVVRPAGDPQSLRRARSNLVDLGIAVHRPDLEVAIEAGRLRAAHRLTLGDAYVLATARDQGATVASFDTRLLRAAASEQIPTLE